MRVRQPVAGSDQGNGNEALPGPGRRTVAADGTGRTGTKAGRDRSRSPAAGRKSEQPGSPWRALIFAGLLLALLGGGAWALLGSSLLVVRHIEVSGNRMVSAAEVRAAAGIRAGTPLATVDTGAAARRVERLAPVLSATVSRSWPDAIVITVRERTPVLAVALIGGGFELVDQYGVVVRTASSRPPGLVLLSNAPAALRGSAAVGGSAAVVRALPASVRARLLSVSASPAGAVTLQLRGHVTVLWGGPGQAELKAAELQMLLRTHAQYYDVSDPATAVTQG